MRFDTPDVLHTIRERRANCNSALSGLYQHFSYFVKYSCKTGIELKSALRPPVVLFLCPPVLLRTVYFVALGQSRRTSAWPRFLDVCLRSGLGAGAEGQVLGQLLL